MRGRIAFYFQPRVRRYAAHDPVQVKADQVRNRKLFTNSALPLGVRDANDAKMVAERLLPGERKLVFDALRKITADQYNEHKRLGNALIDTDDHLRMWYIYFLPNLTVGFIQAAVFINASELILLCGTSFDLTMLGAAGLANVISNLVATILHLPFERVLALIGCKRPLLSAEQLNNPSMKWTVIAAKVFGILCGSAMGLFPLIFHDEQELKREVKARKEEAKRQEQSDDHSKSVKSSAIKLMDMSEAAAPTHFVR